LTFGLGRAFAGAGVAAVVVDCAGAADDVEVVLSLLEPQPAATSARAAVRVRARGRRDIWRGMLATAVPPPCRHEG
jgi:hypothetical protein